MIYFQLERSFKVVRIYFGFSLFAFVFSFEFVTRDFPELSILRIVRQIGDLNDFPFIVFILVRDLGVLFWYFCGSGITAPTKYLQSVYFEFFLFNSFQLSEFFFFPTVFEILASCLIPAVLAFWWELFLYLVDCCYWLDSPSVLHWHRCVNFHIGFLLFFLLVEMLYFF